MLVGTVLIAPGLHASSVSHLHFGYREKVCFGAILLQIQSKGGLGWLFVPKIPAFRGHGGVRVGYKDVFVCNP